MLNGKELGSAIAWAIEQKGVSKKAFAEAMGVKPASVQDWIKYGRLAKNRISPLVDYFRDVVPPEYWGLNFDLTALPDQTFSDEALSPPEFFTAWDEHKDEGVAVTRLLRAIHRAVVHEAMNATEIEALARMIEARALRDEPVIASDKLEEVMAAIEQAETAGRDENHKTNNEKNKRSSRTA